MSEQGKLHHDIISKCYGRSVDEILGALQFVAVYVMGHAEAQEEGAGVELFKIFAKIVNNQMRAEIEAAGSRLKGASHDRQEAASSDDNQPISSE